MSDQRVHEVPPSLLSRPDPVAHICALVDRGAFAVSVCTCGWTSAARRSRPLARAEGADHEQLHRPAAPPTG